MYLALFQTEIFVKRRAVQVKVDVFPSGCILLVESFLKRLRDGGLHGPIIISPRSKVAAENVGDLLAVGSPLSITNVGQHVDAGDLRCEFAVTKHVDCIDEISLRPVLDGTVLRPFRPLPFLVFDHEIADGADTANDGQGELHDVKSG